MSEKKSRKSPLSRKIIQELKEQGLKKCSRCEKILNLADFSKNKNSCKSCCKEMTENWLAKNPDYHRLQRIKRREERRIYNKKWKEKNPEKFLLTKHAYRARKRKEDSLYRIINSLRCRLYNTIIKEYKSQSTLELLGCSLEELKIYLESLFQEGMTWENYGKFGWHIDHIKPCAAFNLLDLEEQKKCFHYTNLQPLWWAENIRKGAKFDEKDLDLD